MLQRGRRSNRVYAIKQVIAFAERRSFLIDVSLVESAKIPLLY